MRKTAIGNSKPRRKSNLDLSKAQDLEDLLVSKPAGQLRVLTSNSLPKLPAERPYARSSPFPRAVPSEGADKAERSDPCSDPPSLPYRSGVREPAYRVRSAGGNRARAESSRLRTPRERRRNGALRFSCSKF